MDKRRAPKINPIPPREPTDTEMLDFLSMNDTSWKHVSWVVHGPGNVSMASLKPDNEYFFESLRAAIKAVMLKRGLL